LRYLILSLLFASFQLAHADEYSVALSKAQRAFLIQSGIDKQIRRVRKQANKAIMRVSNDLGTTEELGIAFGLYHVYKERSVSFKLDGKKFTITPNSLSVTMGF
jgi:hypothetical protein